MIKIRKNSYLLQEEGIDISPLIDMVFILLIFFVVTTSFVKETGVDINKPHASTAEKIVKGNILIAVTESGSIHISNKRIDLLDVRAVVRNEMKNFPDAEAVIVSDKNSRTGLVIQVLDECKLAGIKNVSIAAKKTE
jgi:biopolymer transport protein ExbD